MVLLVRKRLSMNSLGARQLSVNIGQIVVEPCREKGTRIHTLLGQFHYSLMIA